MDLRLGRKVPSNYNQDSAPGMKFDKGIYSGIVKLNVDPLRLGRLRVWIADMGGNETDPNNWRWVNYASPYYGHTTQTEKAQYNTVAGTESTYGMWMVPPDIGNTVLCCFVNGDPGRGYWFACVTSTNMSHGMVPGIGKYSDNVDKATVTSNLVKAALNRAEPTFLPSAEFNENVKANMGANFLTNKLPVHEPQAEIVINQGLDTDRVRGTPSSSSMRDAPSSVFGISTPGRTPVTGNRTTPKYRVGGHQFVMDDGDDAGVDQLIRLRTAGGHQILMNDSEQVLYIANNTGTAWMEFGNNGQIHMYANKGFNVRTDGDLNLHSQKNVNIQGDEVRIRAKSNLGLESAAMNLRAADSLKMFSGKIDIGSQGALSVTASGGLGIATRTELRLVGNNFIRLNDGAVAEVTDPGFLQLNQLPSTTKTALQLYQSNAADSPDHLESIVTAAPDHEPWPRNTDPIAIVQMPIPAGLEIGSGAAATNTEAVATISTLDVQVAPVVGICTDVPPAPVTAPGSTSPAGAGPFGDWIAGYESASAGYNAFNRGSSPPRGTGTVGGEKIDLVNMTVSEILARQASNEPDPTKRLFAVGRYQIIPVTLTDAITKLKIPSSQKFTAEFQDNLFVNYLCKGSRPSINKYLTGSNQDDEAALLQAQVATAACWASVEDPTLGRGRYDGQGTNTAHAKAVDCKKKLKEQWAWLRKANATVKTASGATWTDGSGNPIQSGIANDDLGIQATAGKEVTQKAPTEKMATSTLQVQGDLIGKGTPGEKNSIPGLTAKQQKALAVEIGFAESGGSIGYKTADRIGKYAINAVLLKEYGYIKSDYLSKYKLDAINQTGAWTGKDEVNSLADFLKTETAQDFCMVSFIKDAWSRLFNSRGIDFDDSICVAGGMVYATYFFRDETQLFGSDVNAMVLSAKSWRKQNTGKDSKGATPHEVYNRGRYAVDILSQVQPASTGAPARVATTSTSTPPTGAATIPPISVDIKPDDVLVFTARSGDRAHFDVAISTFKDSILSMAKEYKQRTGKKVTVSSTVRTQAEQTAIYNGWVAAGGHMPDRPTVNVPPYGSISRPVAKVGIHGHGSAMDIMPDQAGELEQMGLLAKYGLWRFDPSGDPPHVQPNQPVASLLSLPIIQST